MDSYSMACIVGECNNYGSEEKFLLCDANEKVGDGHDFPWSRFEQVPYVEGVEGTRMVVVRKTTPPSDFLQNLSAKIL